MALVSRLRSRLTRQIGRETAIRVQRRSEPGSKLDGFVVAVGKKWVLLQRKMDGGFFDGHVAIRLSDVKRVSADKSFESRFARTQPEWPPSLPECSDTADLDSTAGMLRSLLVPARLVGLERTKPTGATWIGLPYALERKELYLWEVTPQATWHEEPLGYSLRSITTVVLNNHYQRGLSAVAGQPPTSALDSPWPPAPART